jgi:xylulokinase
VICSGHVLAALPAAISGILFAFYTNSVSPSTHGNFYELYGIKNWRQFGELLKKTSPGNAGGILLPWFEAKIVPRVNQPGIHHFDLDEKNVAANCRAIFEAQMMSMRLQSQWMKVSPEKIYATGGASNDLALLQVMAGAMNCRVLRIEVAKSAAHGGLVQVGEKPTWEEVVNGFSNPIPNSEICPHPKAARIYDKLVEKYANRERAALEKIAN